MVTHCFNCQGHGNFHDPMIYTPGSARVTANSTVLNCGAIPMLQYLSMTTRPCVDVSSGPFQEETVDCRLHLVDQFSPDSSISCPACSAAARDPTDSSGVARCRPDLFNSTRKFIFRKLEGESATRRLQSHSQSRTRVSEKRQGCSDRGMQGNRPGSCFRGRDRMKCRSVSYKRHGGMVRPCRGRNKLLILD